MSWGIRSSSESEAYSRMIFRLSFATGLPAEPASPAAAGPLPPPAPGPPVAQEKNIALRTFCEVEPGTAFWYENAFGLVEVAVNQGRADHVLGLGPGDDIASLCGQ